MEQYLVSYKEKDHSTYNGWLGSQVRNVGASAASTILDVVIATLVAVVNAAAATVAAALAAAVHISIAAAIAAAEHVAAANDAYLYVNLSRDRSRNQRGNGPVVGAFIERVRPVLPLLPSILFFLFITTI